MDITMVTIPYNKKMLINAFTSTSFIKQIYFKRKVLLSTEIQW